MIQETSAPGSAEPQLRNACPNFWGVKAELGLRVPGREEPVFFKIWYHPGGGRLPDGEKRQRSAAPLSPENGARGSALTGVLFESGAVAIFRNLDAWQGAWE